METSLTKTLHTRTMHLCFPPPEIPTLTLWEFAVSWFWGIIRRALPLSKIVAQAKSEGVRGAWLQALWRPRRHPTEKSREIVHFLGGEDDEPKYSGELNQRGGGKPPGRMNHRRNKGAIAPLALTYSPSDPRAPRVHGRQVPPVTRRYSEPLGHSVSTLGPGRSVWRRH